MSAASRRTFLRGLGALPAIAVPAVALPAVAAPSPEAALIALARQLEETVRREKVACERWYAIEDRYDDMKPARPTHPGSVPSRPWVEEQSAVDMREHLTKAAEVNTESDLAPYRARLARMEAWEAECEVIKLRLGLRAAERLARRWGRRMEAAAADLIATRPATLAGAVAKVSAAANVRTTFHCCAFPQWVDDLTDAALRDMVEVGGAA